MHKNTSKISLVGRPEEVAVNLLGCHLIRQVGMHKLMVKIVEVELYDQSDAASHSYRGRTPRTDVMFGPPGRAYVYFTYGMHFCMNVVIGEEGTGSAVLLRAGEPLEGIEFMRGQRPSAKTDTELTNGPAKLCYALSINKEFSGHDLSLPPLKLGLGVAVSKKDVVQTTRVGISKDTDRPWRWYIQGNPYVSRQ